MANKKDPIKEMERYFEKEVVEKVKELDNIKYYWRAVLNTLEYLNYSEKIGISDFDKVVEILNKYNNLEDTSLYDNDTKSKCVAPALKEILKVMFNYIGQPQDILKYNNNRGDKYEIEKDEKKIILVKYDSNNNKVDRNNKEDKSNVVKQTTKNKDLNTEEAKSLIEAMKELVKREGKIHGLLFFGYDYAEKIANYNVMDLLRGAGYGEDSVNSYISHGKALKERKNRKVNSVSKWEYLKNEKGQCPHNRIVFGAPGTGKSKKLKDETEKMDEKYVTRVTFHPDYSYAHFVGCYKPYMEGANIRYEFIAGPFLEVYKKAKKDPDNHYVLIIEEINRANVAAVFGDVFQLLDRYDKDNEEKGEVKGESEYPINTSEDVQKWLTDNDVLDAEKLSIPKNMYIWATMNSADQGVYPMDTAFKRRWTFEYMDINNGVNDELEKWQVQIGGKEYNWNKLRTEINKTLLSANINEDKCLGPYFIKGDENNPVDSAEFASKVLMYLFEDVVKQKPSRIFNAELKGFSSIYNKVTKKCELKEVFVKEISEKVEPSKTETKSTNSEDNSEAQELKTSNLTEKLDNDGQEETA